MGGGFYVREQKYICGKNYATAPTMQAEFFEVSEKEHKASTRRKKELATSLAKEAYNLRKSGRYLVLLVNTNFRPGDYSVTYTYDDEHHPAPNDLARADRDFSNAIKKLYRLCDKQGIQRPKWVVVTEYCTMDPVTGEVLGRHHHHVIMTHPAVLTVKMNNAAERYTLDRDKRGARKARIALEDRTTPLMVETFLLPAGKLGKTANEREILAERRDAADMVARYYVEALHDMSYTVEQIAAVMRETRSNFEQFLGWSEDGEMVAYEKLCRMVEGIYGVVAMVERVNGKGPIFGTEF